MPIILETDPAFGQDLTTLEAVREWLQKNAGVTTGQDPLVENLIHRASVMLQGTLGREFTPAVGVTRSFMYYGGGTVQIAPYDLRTVTAVTYDAQGTPVSLVDGDWHLRPAITSTGTYRSLYLPDYVSDNRYRTITDSVVSITGDWGFAAVPADVEHGCIVTVATWLREGAAFNPDGNVVSFERRGKIPQDVLDGLEHYRLPTV